MEIETGFPCFPTLKESDGEGRGRIFEGGLLLDLGDSFEEIRLIYLMFEEREKPMREMRTIFLSLISPLASLRLGLTILGSYCSHTGTWIFNLFFKKLF